MSILHESAGIPGFESRCIIGIKRACHEACKVAEEDEMNNDFNLYCPVLSETTFASEPGAETSISAESTTLSPRRFECA
jgi:hypothetical protein